MSKRFFWKNGSGYQVEKFNFENPNKEWIVEGLYGNVPKGKPKKNSQNKNNLCWEIIRFKILSYCTLLLPWCNVEWGQMMVGSHISVLFGFKYTKY